MRDKDIQQEILALPPMVESSFVTDDASYHKAYEILINIKVLEKKIDAAYDSIIKKAYDAHKEVIGRKEEMKIPLKDAERRLKSSIISYEAEQKSLRGDGETKQELEDIGKGPIFQLPVVASSIIPKINGISIAKTWKYKIYDVALVPKEYMMIDQTKLNRILHATRGCITIPGIDIYSEDSVRVRA